ncbi:MAG: hypothetical protein KIS72_05775, partial [Luteimonas sp.]|nr:hypothetical protein [Luteimonas sp.]
MRAVANGGFLIHSWKLDAHSMGELRDAMRVYRRSQDQFDAFVAAAECFASFQRSASAADTFSPTKLRDVRSQLSAVRAGTHKGEAPAAWPYLAEELLLNMGVRQPHMATEDQLRCAAERALSALPQPSRGRPAQQRENPGR